jgi:Holliday junction resolvasome RuvABC endonuclease subunit
MSASNHFFFEQSTEKENELKAAVQEKEVLKNQRRKERNKRKKEQNEDKKVETFDEIQKHSNVIGLDISIKSPAMAIYRKASETMYMIAFAQTDKQHSILPLSKCKQYHELIQNVTDVGKVHLKLYRRQKQQTDQNDLQRYKTMHDIFLKELEQIIPVSEIKETPAVFENYAFNARDTNNLTRLAECTGILKHRLIFEKGFPVYEIPSTTIKKWWSGSGNADKTKMMERFQSLFGKALDLDALLPHEVKVKNKIPSPHQDIVDSFAIMHSIQRLQSGEKLDAAKPKRKKI